jgi:protein TonB
MAYRVPRRFIVPPAEPPPYGLLLASLLGHAGFLLMAGLLSAYLNLQADQSKIYIVNLVPAAPPIGSPEPRVVEAPRRVEARTPPKPELVEAPRPRETPPPKPEKETPPPRPEKAETPLPKLERTPEKAELPRPKETPPPPPEKAPELPPQLAEIPKPRTAPERPLDLPKRPEREVARDRTPLPEAKPVLTPPPPPAAPTRTVEPPRPEPPRAVPAPAPPPPLPAVAAAKPGPEPVKPGRPDGTSTPLSNISVDVSDFPFTYYLRQLQNKITEKWQPPRGASVGGEKAIVLFEIDREGQIKEPSVERSSGNAIYDQSAVRAVLDASPFPPLPQGFPGRSLRVHFGFEYKPDQG